MTKKSTILPWILVIVVIVGIGYFLLKGDNASLVRNDYVNGNLFSSTTPENASSTSAYSTTTSITNNGNGTSNVESVATVPQATSRIGLPNTGGNVATPKPAATPKPTVVPGPTVSVLYPRISVAVADNNQLVPASMHTVSWGYNGVPSQSFGQLRVELIEPYRVDRGPLLLANYSGALNMMPNYITWTVPSMFDAGEWYAIRVTYNSSVTYTGVSQYFRIIPSGTSNISNSNTSSVNYPSSYGTAVIENTTQPTVTNAVERNTIPLLRFMVTAPNDSSVTLTHFAVGSPVGNDVFNYVENLKANVNGSVIPMSFINQYLEGTTIWSLQTPVIIPAHSSVTFTLSADVKPGLHNATFQTAVKGGRANVNVSGSVTGPVISVQ